MKPQGRICCVLALLMGFAAPAPAAGVQTAAPLVPLLRVGPWRGISALIAYRGRLWFANSEKFVNHNSADLYS